MQPALKRIVPVGFALFPIGMLFGVLAAQANWSATEVFLMSVIGFTGSGQFAFLGFASQGLKNLDLVVVFLIILSMNLRYIPMSLSASHPLRVSVVNKFLLSHWLADESYASEHSNDSLSSRAIIRLCILAFWAVSTSAGVLLAFWLPTAVCDALAGVTFPINAILVALSVTNVKQFVSHPYVNKVKCLACFVLCISIVLLLQALLGMVYFWLPSIGICYFILLKLQKEKL